MGRELEVKVTTLCIVWLFFNSVCSSSFLSFFFVFVRFVNPSNRGSLAVSMLLLYVLMGVPAGYSSSVLYKSFKGRQWQQCTLMTALLFPSVCFVVFLALNLMSQRYHSTQVRRVHKPASFDVMVDRQYTLLLLVYVTISLAGTST